MDTNLFRKNVSRTLDVKGTKDTLRRAARKNQLAHSTRAVIGLKTSVGEVTRSLHKYLLGFQITDAMRKEAKAALAEVYYNMAILSKVLKSPMPASRKKVLLKGQTLTDALLKLEERATDLLNCVNTAFQGHDLEVEEIKQKFEGIPLLVYQITGTMLNIPAGVIMDIEQDLLDDLYPEGYFGTAHRGEEQGKGKEASASVKLSPGIKIVKKPGSHPQATA